MAQSSACWTRLTNEMYYYKDVLDFMMQHHPEYVSLAWDVFKFIFVVSSLPRSSPRVAQLT